jgi:hypothetical protein
MACVFLLLALFPLWLWPPLHCALRMSSRRDIARLCIAHARVHGAMVGRLADRARQTESDFGCAAQSCIAMATRANMHTNCEHFILTCQLASCCCFMHPLLLLLLHLVLAHKLASVCSPPWGIRVVLQPVRGFPLSCSSLPDVQNLAVFETIQT